MDLLTFLRLIVLITNGVYCFVPRGDFASSSTKELSPPIQQQNAEANDISVYDPGDVGKFISIYYITCITCIM